MQRRYVGSANNKVERPAIKKQEVLAAHAPEIDEHSRASQYSDGEHFVITPSRRASPSSFAPVAPEFRYKNVVNEQSRAGAY